MDVREMLKSGRLQVGKDSKIVQDGKRIRNEDGSRFTISPEQKRRAERRKQNKIARKARRRNKL